jgi:hypothetical protein
MKHITRIALAALTIGGLTLSLQAQDDARPPRGGMNRPGPGMVPPLVKALDADKDGILSAAEIAAAPAALLTLDGDKDGALSLEELRPQRPAGAPDNAPADRPNRPQRPQGDRPQGDRPDMREGRGPRGDMPAGPRPGANPIVGALDANHDGVIDATEIANASTALKTLVNTDDGSISLKELRPGRPDGAGEEGGPRGPRGPRGPGGPGGPRGE